MNSPLTLLGLAATLALSSCTVTLKTSSHEMEDETGTPAVAPAPEAPAAPKKSAKQDRDEDRPGLERSVELARRDLQIAEYEASMALESARWAVEGAEAKLEAARERLERFGALEVEIEVAQSEMGVDRAEDRLVRDQQDLQGILDIYAEEEEARSRDEIIRRHRMQVRFAERSLDLARRNHALKVEHELPAKQRELERAVKEADQALDAAADRLNKQELENERDLLRKRGALEDAERKLAKQERGEGSDA